MRAFFAVILSALALSTIVYSLSTYNPGPSKELLVADDNGIWAINIEPNEAMPKPATRDLWLTPHRDIGGKRTQDVESAPGDIAVDAAQRAIFWLIPIKGEVWTMGSNGEAPKRLDGLGVGSGWARRGIATDTVHKQLYMTMTEGIQTADYTGKNANTPDALRSPFVGPRTNGITVDSQGYLVWTNADSASGNIRSSHINSKESYGPIDILVDKIARPLRVAVDDAGSVYWTEPKRIMKLSATGGPIELVTSRYDDIHIAIDSIGGQIYWSEGSVIKRAKLDGTEAEDFMTGFSRVSGLALQDTQL